MEKILITGISGFLGNTLAVYLRNKYDVFGSYNRHYNKVEGCTSVQMDLMKGGDVWNIILKVKPSIVIHVASRNDIDWSEQNKMLVDNINTHSLTFLLQTQIKDFFLIYISSDQVYSGQKKFSVEADVPKPINMVGKSKLKSELMIRRQSKNFCILRLPELYGLSNRIHKSYSDTVLSTIQKGNEVKLFADEFMTPLYVGDAITAIEKVIEAGPKVNKFYNLGGPERINRFAFGLKVCEYFGIDSKLIKPLLIEQTPLKKLIPYDRSMLSTKFYKELNFEAIGIEEGLEKYKQTMLTGSFIY